MLGNIACWIIALGLILSKSVGTGELYTKLYFAMGFILLGIISKAVDVYYEIHKNKNA